MKRRINSLSERQKPPITYGFGRVFRRIKKREVFASPPLEDPAIFMFDALVAAAIAKCVDFNVAVNRARKYTDEDFAFVSNLRGICEDLISLSYFSGIQQEKRQELTGLLINKHLIEGLEIQKSFFAANNPFQPVLGLPSSPDSDDLSASHSARAAVREFWKREGSTRRDGPRIKDMAEAVGLKFTYDYIYYVSSNFTHFNPQALLRTGWGSDRFYFSVSNINGYYKSLGSFYGAVLFLGYHAAFRSQHFSARCDKDAAELIDLIEQTQRWPEIVPFEEMNEKPPLYLLTHAMRRAFPDGAPDGILAEVRALGDRLSRV